MTTERTGGADGRADVSVIVLTLNEEAHIRRCLENVSGLARDVFVVDCYSKDRTRELVLGVEGSDVLREDAGGAVQAPRAGEAAAASCGIHFIQHAWPGTHADQFNWALDHLPIRTGWVLRLDADEYLLPELAGEIRSKLPAMPAEVSGVVFKLRRFFLGRHIRHGMPRVRLLRLFRTGRARCERRLMDEHLAVLEGGVAEFDGEFADDNRNDIGWWTAKHNGYALREAACLLGCECGLIGGEGVPNGPAGALSGAAQRKRAAKGLYARLPLFARAFAYFVFRYVLLGGFLDGREGFLWHFLQGWWYRTLVDAKVWEIRRESGGDRERMRALLRDKYGMKI